ncbi:hypothetical protein [Colwellia sp. Bg11-28]|uniref:hypothetical protein n=1 Tax=Colwellia sp. Bg11-28 TaxID=2058305 RepID=UPI000C32A223|nr:hypothetical protein [Colwellia sp. Bg11-28]PKH88297.1 hypothetical protein CXF79_05915 [Colwellia sp. Bg11-28]
MLKGPYTAIIISVLLHLLLLLALIYGATQQPKIIKQDKPKITSIKSFLYSAPKKTVSEPAITPKSVEERKTPQKVEQKQAAPKKTVRTEPSKTAVKTPPNTPVNKPVTKTPSTQVTNAVKSETVTTKNKVLGASRGSFSSYDRLSRLRQKLDDQQREQAFSELTQPRSTSEMDGEPFPVPKTIVPLTVEQRQKLNTSSSHVGSITKNDNGTCTIYREQVLGSPVHATTAYFACGESKFDKSFREHMEKVQAKFKVPNK